MKVIAVAVGVVFNSANQVLLAKRPSHVHQGGKWEFPGGKVEGGESTRSALVRELREEVGIVATSIEPLMTLDHRYPDKAVRLIVYNVRAFLGVAKGLENQQVVWTAIDTLHQYDFPVANSPIVEEVINRYQ